MIQTPAFCVIARIFKWSRIAAKIAALGTALAGALTLLVQTSIMTSILLGAVGATTYAAARTIPEMGYERTRHISPRPDGSPLRSPSHGNRTRTAKSVSQQRRLASSLSNRTHKKV
jgi:hypothetical protein